MEIYNLVIGSNFSNICGAVNKIIDYLLVHYGKIDECSIFEIKVILNELISNGIKHGNMENSHKSVKIGTGITNGGYAFFLVEDEGEGYDYKNLFQKKCSPEDIFNLEDVKETGRGIMIVKNLCDRIRFNRKGNKVIVLKKLYRP